MATFSKYKLYELYETDDGINWIPTGEYKAVLSEMYSDDCGYSARTIVDYDYECSGTTKIITATTKYQETYDSGSTWITTASSSSVTYEEKSIDCGYSARTIVDYDYNCNGTTKIITATTKNQETYDSGETWITTASSSSVTYEYNSEDCGYTPKDYPEQYLTFVAKTSGTFEYSGDGISYSTDNGVTWSRISTKYTVEVNNGDIVLWKGNAASFGVGVGQFSGGTASFDVQGNIMSLLYGDNFVNQKDLSEYNGAFRYLFKDSKVVNAKNLILPATTLSFSCYNEMFNGCTSLITAPVLSATTLDSHCYAYMFMNCSSLATAPQLPATTLATSCYHSMFEGCTSLTTAPELNATTLANWCYGYMFRYCTNLNYIKMLATNITSDSFSLYYWVEGVANSGTFVKAASMTNLPSGNSGIPNNWTVQNA